MSRGGFDPDPLIVDHMRLVTSLEHRRRYQRAWRRLATGGGIREPRIVHERDDACCQLEPWPVSLAKLIAATGKTTLVVRL